jgi:hypothetical protein
MTLATQASHLDMEVNCSGDACPREVPQDHVSVQQLVAENAALKVALEAREELLELRVEMMEQLMNVMVEKVELECRLAAVEKMHAEREKLLHESQALVAENARLKTIAEAANAHHEAEKHQLQLAFENERLKWRVAELERQVEKSSVPHTAKVPGPTKY